MKSSTQKEIKLEKNNNGFFCFLWQGIKHFLWGTFNLSWFFGLPIISLKLNSAWGLIPLSVWVLTLVYIEYWISKDENCTNNQKKIK